MVLLFLVKKYSTWNSWLSLVRLDLLFIGTGPPSVGLTANTRGQGEGGFDYVKSEFINYFT